MANEISLQAPEELDPERPRPSIGTAFPAASGAPVWLAGAVFAAGLVSWAGLDRSIPAAPATDATGAVVKEKPAAAAPVAGSISPVLLPWAPGLEAAAGDGLQAFSLPAPIVDERPALPLPEAPSAAIDAPPPAGRRVEEAALARLALKGSLTGLFRYEGADNDALRPIKLLQRREVWLLAKLPPPPPAQPAIPRPSGPPQAAAPAARRARVWRSQTAGTVRADPAAGPAAAPAVQQAAPVPAGTPVVVKDAGNSIARSYADAARNQKPHATSADLKQQMRGVDTNHAGIWSGFLCTVGLFSCSRTAQGAITAVSPDGTRLTHTYDGTKDYGERNRLQITTASGEQLELKASPLVFDLDGDGVKTSARFVRYDVDGDGVLDRFHDVSSKDGVLVFDADGDGVAGAHARELFGDRTDLGGDGRPDGFDDGFAALRGLAEKAIREGGLPAGSLADAELDAAELESLRSRYGLGMRVGGLKARTVSLREAGVNSVNLSRAAPMRIADFDGQGNETLRQEGATFLRADGSTGAYEDIWFKGATPRRVAWAR